MCVNLVIVHFLSFFFSSEFYESKIFCMPLISSSPESVHIGMDKNFNEGKKKIKDKPNVDHLDVGSFRQVVGDIDEHGGQHQHCLKRKELT